MTHFDELSMVSSWLFILALRKLGYKTDSYDLMKWIDNITDTNR